jgi:hypothetical protein
MQQVQYWLQYGRSALGRSSCSFLLLTSEQYLPLEWLGELVETQAGTMDQSKQLKHRVLLPLHQGLYFLARG